ncbi:MAG TPA: hypothetical protein ENL03_02255 [Phycisphaerae bacterium]|nr:hypothetical protein [Phycisphaerae bacterium]
MISELTDWQAIAALTGPGSIGEVDVEGMGLLQAINAVLSPAGFGFVIEPWAVQRGGGPPAHRLLVFSKSTVTTRKRPFLAPCGVSMDSEEGRRSELQQMSFVRDSRSVSNDVTVHGDNKRLEVTLAFTADSQTRQLHPAWDTYEHDLGYYAGLSDTICPLQWSADQMETFARNYHKSGDGFWQFKDVFRSFTFNEDGAFTSILGLYPPDIGDVSAGLADENGAFLARPRRLGPTLQYGSSGSQLHSAPARVEMCIAGCDDAKVLLPVQFWPDRCGFTLRLDEFFSLSPAGIGDIYRPFAQLTGSEYKINDIDRTDEIKQASWLNLLLNTIDDYDGLKVRIELICTLPADSRVTGKAGRRLESDWPFRSEKVISMPQRFQSQRSLAGDNDIDQTSEALAMAESIRSDAEQPMVKGVFSLRYLSRAYVPGDGINFTAGRVVDLVNGPDGGDTSMITSVLWSFGPGKNKTQLQIQNPKGG